MRFNLLLLGLILCGVLSLYSQSNNTSRINIYVSDKDDMTEILLGANVSIMSGNDSISGSAVKYNTVLATQACFQSNKIFKDSVDLRVTYVGYKPFFRRYSAEQFAGNIFVKMEQDETMISQIVVIGQSVAIVIKGDTTVYNSSAFKTMQGDRFAELLKQLPGIEIKDNKIYANGDEIKRVYVDGRNLFGANTAHTLTDIEAADVKNVRVYEEENLQAKRLNDKTVPKDRVMDVVTHSKRTVVKGGEVSLAGGASLEKDYSGKHEVRHTENLSLYRNSEAGSIRLSASNSKNDGQKDNASFDSKVIPSEQSDVYMMYDYRRGDSTTIMTYANFRRDNSHRIETALTEYFPSDSYKQRLTESVSDAIAKSWNLRASNSVNILRRKNSFSSEIGFETEKYENRSNVETLQIIEDQQTYTQLRDQNNSRDIKVKATLNYRRKISEKSLLTISASGNYSQRSGDQWNIDTLASTPGLRVLLNNDANSRQTNISASSEFKREIGDNSAITIAYIFAHDYNKSKQMSIDYLSAPEGVVDNVNSYDYTINSYWNTLSTNWSYSKKNTMCTVGFRGSIYGVGNEERTPKADNTSHTFLLFNPFASFSIGTVQNRWTIGMGSFSNIISVEMLRNSLDASNPMFMRAGNSDLRPSNNTYINVNYSTTDPKKARTLLFGFKAGYIFNYIAARQTLFMEDTFLPQYDYTAQRGSQLNTNVNVGGNYNLGISTNYSQRVSFLKSTLRTSINYDYKQTPYYLSDRLQKSHNHEIKAIVGINTGFSENIRINFNSNTGVGYYTTENETTRYIRESLDGNIDVRFASKYSILAKAIYEIYDNDRSSVATHNNVIANVAVGRKFGKENQTSLSIGVVDIFNQTSYVSTILNSDYMRTSTTSYLGRYGYLMFSFIF